MFLENKYTDWYNSLIAKAKTKNLSKKTSDIYLELHHIVPRSINGSNSPDNLVLLSAKEHFVAHKLLTKMTTGIDKRKMSMALFCMVTANRSGKVKKIVSSNAYQKIRSEYTKLVIGKNHFNYGIVRSEETKNKIRAAREKQSPLSKEHYEHLSKVMTGRICINNGINTIKVYPKDVDSYIEKGFTIGRKPYIYTEEYRMMQSKKCKAQWENVKSGKLTSLIQL